jgi:hypothetical protein
MNQYLWESIFIPGIKLHVSLSKFIDPIKDDLHYQYGGDFSECDIEEVDSILIDYPGMIMMDRTLETIKLDTLKIKIPSTDFGSILFDLKSSPARYFTNDEVYYKLKGYTVCLVLTKDQRDALMKSMEEALPDVRVRAEKDIAEFEKRLSGINKGKEKIVSDRLKKGRN